MLLDIVDDGGTGLDGSDVLSRELLTVEDGIDTPADGAGQRIVEHDIDFAKFGLWIQFVPLGDLAFQDACKVLDGDARVGIGVVDDDGQTVVRDGDRIALGMYLRSMRFWRSFGVKSRVVKASHVSSFISFFTASCSLI